MLFLAFGQPEFDFGMAPLGEIDAERDERETLLLRLAKELIDLLAVEEEFSSTERLVIHDVAVAVRTDVTIEQPDFSVLHKTVAVLEVDLPFANRLDLGTLQHHAGFKGFEYVVVMVGLSIKTGCVTAR